MKWYERQGILSYIIDCYQGVERQPSGKDERQFLWEEPNGDIVIGNARAFSVHLESKFALSMGRQPWGPVHEVLRAVGEVVEIHKPFSKSPGRPHVDPKLKIRILKKGRS